MLEQSFGSGVIAVSSFRNECVVATPLVRSLRRTDFKTLILLEREIEVEEFGESMIGSTSSSYYLRMCCEHLQQTSLFMEIDGEPAGYLLSFMQGREAFCGAFGAKQNACKAGALACMMERFLEMVRPRVDVLWWTVPQNATDRRALLQHLGGVEVEHRAASGIRERGRVLVRLSKDQMPKGAGALSFGQPNALG